MAGIKLTTLNADVEENWVPGGGPNEVTVRLCFGSTEITSWKVPPEQARQFESGHYPEQRDEALEGFVADKLAELFAKED